jgi:hypothetical protein
MEAHSLRDALAGDATVKAEPELKELAASSGYHP